MNFSTIMHKFFATPIVPINDILEFFYGVKYVIIKNYNIVGIILGAYTGLRGAIG